MKVLIFGVSGMLGNAVFKYLSLASKLDVYGTLRHAEALRFFSPKAANKLTTAVHIEDLSSIENLIATVKPAVVINCIGLIKRLSEDNDPITAMPANAVFPHQLLKLCSQYHARLIHISTDCVFSGKKGNYKESDKPDATDVYGRSKLLGEVDAAYALTLRTSIIGHELSTQKSIVNWFLAQEQPIKGFSQAIFSGLTTVELSKVISDIITFHPTLSGIYHIAGEPISKYELLQLVAKQYGKSIEILKDDSLIIDKSLDATRFYNATGYQAPAWPELIQAMYEFQHLTSLDSTFDRLAYPATLAHQ